MEPFIGQIMSVGFNFAPVGWARCDGQLLSIASNTALFSLLGTTYGGDGRTTFGLPDLRGRINLHNGNGPGLSNYIIGAKSGSETNILNVTNLPAHSHTATFNASAADANASTPFSGASIATPGQQSGRSFVPSLGFNSATPDQPLNGLTVGNTGSNIPVNNIQPYQVTTWIIALQGIFPSRS